MAGMEQYPQEWRDYEPIQPRGFDWRGALRKLWAPVAALGAFLAKFGAVLLKFKFLFSMFISFMGALITLKQMPHDAWREARLAIAGPILGSAGALALYVAGAAYDSRELKALAFLGFFINLFNLLPVIPLDGG